MNKSISLLIVLAILAVTLIVAVQIVKAQFLGSVYINPDGSVTGTNTIRRDGNLYTLTGNILGGIQVQKSYIVIDGAGYTVQGSGAGRGIDLSNGSGEDPSRTPSSNVTVKNLRVVNFTHGIDNANANNNTFYGNYVANCDVGFWIIGSANNTITHNTIKDNIDGISIDYAGNNNVITENNIINNGVIVWLSSQPMVDRNYWSAYNGTDSNGDGIGDTVYVYSGTFADNNPQVKEILIPEFPSWIILPLLIAATLCAIGIKKKHIRSWIRLPK